MSKKINTLSKNQKKLGKKSSAPKNITFSGRKARSPLLQAISMITTRKEPICAKVVDPHSMKVIVNLTAIVVGPVMTNPLKDL